MTKDTVTLARSMYESDFRSLDPETQTRVLSSWVDASRQMQEAGQRAPVWECSIPEVEVINHEITAKTEVGEIVGKAVYFGIVRDVDGVFKRTVIVHVPSSGSIFSVPSRNVRLAGADDHDRLRNEMRMASALAASTSTVAQIVRTRRQARVGGSHLLEPMLDAARSKGLVIDDKSGFHKIFGNRKKVCVYLSKKGGRADLSGFCIDDPAVVPMSAEEAKEKHLGKVRGQVDFSADDRLVVAAWDRILVELG